ncbi:tRNA (adenosine(37)-N6)-threonylcarbamoyltransferase complex transferase subunit TsaD [candidate division LCP-89 bacterium B3_LCP]|uniref:tRNA N6-adenosine threonylcarbamoyltransferase n=1 Tax=candidate division LCP-89 bacterium B3_LCP TaxID=2012998 RepID=A0A532V5K7_UNCL8|nr:MAG: tRNA (adenosine(37)-N6)-threonylcarbamoyltransferase complex transferase subunit TsaD [candidate division LCP-89 bacterium B3_LCP]
MIVLGIETSCDETAAAILQDGAVLSSIVSTHWLHSKYGGVVPELASRAHLNLLPMIITQALDESEIDFDKIDAVAVTKGPGLIGALLVGISIAKAIAYAKNIPLIGVNHLEGHLWSAALEGNPPRPPFLALLVSGGHTLLVGVQAFGQYELIGQTRDDAAGEAFDKVAVLCGLGYPGGAEVEKLAAFGNMKYHQFPVSMRGQAGFDFSFSGLKTAVSNFIRRTPDALDNHRNDLLVCFQHAAIESLVHPTCRAFDEGDYNGLVLSGGVAANNQLRQRLSGEIEKRDGTFHSPEPNMCTDNATMIAWVGWQRLLNGERDDLSLCGRPDLPLTEILEKGRR